MKHMEKAPVATAAVAPGRFGLLDAGRRAAGRVHRGIHRHRKRVEPSTGWNCRLVPDPGELERDLWPMRYIRGIG